MVDVELEMVEGSVELRRLVRLRISSSSTKRKGRYLLLSEELRTFSEFLDFNFSLIPLRVLCTGPLIFNFLVGSESGSFEEAKSSSGPRFFLSVRGACCSTGLG